MKATIDQAISVIAIRVGQIKKEVEKIEAHLGIEADPDLLKSAEDILAEITDDT